MKRTSRALLFLAVIAVLSVAFIYGLGFLRRTVLQPKWKITKVPEEEVIGFVLYTVDDQVLNLTAQLYQLEPEADRTVRLEIKMDGEWEQIATTEVWEPEFIAPFQVKDWDDSQDHEYRVRHGEKAAYTGLIRANPLDKEEIVVAAFTGNGNSDRGPRPDIIKNIQRIDPDLLFFSGDQVYDHQDHLVSWLLWGRQFGEITRDRPTVVIPDDHDVGNANLWGNGGEPGFGGYQDPAYVRQVENAQTSHLPDPYDPTPIQRGIGTYYTSLTWGRIGFAILEDRKFKSQIDILDREMLESKGVVFSRPDHIEQLPDPDFLDVPEGTLLGERQLAFLEEWTADWSGQDMKAVLSQAPFAAVAHLHGPSRVRLAADLDSNGWPQSARDRALGKIRKGFAIMINGDQHLATVIQQGVEDFGDAGYSFSMPSVVNHYRRWWSPEGTTNTDEEGALAYTGQYLDNFGNKITMYAYANPNPTRTTYNRWLSQGAGFGVTRFNKRKRTITMECWPRGCDITDPTCEQYPGWPITITQEENYGRKATAYLPTIQVLDADDPVIQVVNDSTGETIYTLRIHGRSYRPKVFQKGTYTIKVHSRENQVVVTGVESLPEEVRERIQIQLKEKEE
ncbi:MAG: alkaline phosphatase D family protein [Anaerolineales bacterium]